MLGLFVGLEPILLAGPSWVSLWDPKLRDRRDPHLRISPTRSLLGFYPDGRGRDAYVNGAPSV